MRKKIKVFVVPTSYPNPDNPVANSFIQELVKSLSNYECEIIVLNVQKQPTNKIFKKINKNIIHDHDGVSLVYRIKCKTFFEKKFVLLNQFLFNIAMNKLIKEAKREYGKPDIIFAHFYKAAATAIKYKKIFHVPILTMEHSGELMNKRIKFIDKIILKYAVENSNHYICTTENLKIHIENFVNTKNSNIKVIPNVIDDMFTYKPIQSDLNKFCFFSLSRLEYDKRVDLLINSFLNVFKENENVQLLIGGTGPEIHKLEKLVNEQNGQKQIMFLGSLNRTQVLNYMQKCNCFVLPSRHETFGLVWREALCVGRPIITTNHGGFSKSDWSNEYGIMINVDDEEDLNNALIKMVNEFNRYDFKAISKKNREMYDMKIIGGKIYQIMLDDILECK